MSTRIGTRSRMSRMIGIASAMSILSAFPTFAESGLRSAPLSVADKTRSVHITDIPTNLPDHFLQVSVDYDKGGPRIDGDGQAPRGYTVRVQLVHDKTLTSSDNSITTFRSLLFRPGAGGNVWIEQTGAYSRQKLIDHAERFAKIGSENLVFSNLLTKIAENNDLTLYGPWGDGIGFQSDESTAAGIALYRSLQQKQVDFIATEWLAGRDAAFRAEVERINAEAGTPKTAADVPLGEPIYHAAFQTLGHPEAYYENWRTAAFG